MVTKMHIGMFLEALPVAARKVIKDEERIRIIQRIVRTGFTAMNINEHQRNYI